MINTAREALYTYLGLSQDLAATFSQRNINTGQYTKAIYSFNNFYWCASKTGQLPQPKNPDRPRFNWVEMPAHSFIETTGYKVYIRTKID